MVIYGLAKAGSLGKLYVSRNLSIKELIVIMLLKLGDNLHREQKTAVIHSYKNSRDRKIGVVHSLDAVDEEGNVIFTLTK